MKDSISLQQFRAWLEKQPIESVVGKRRSLKHCPLAYFRNEKHPGIYDVSYPLWTFDFMKAIDSQAKRGLAVSREEALKILREIR